MNKTAILILLLLILYGCSPKVNILKTSVTSNSRPIESYLPFGIIEIDTVEFDTKNLLGKIEIKDTGFSLKCDYESVKAIAKKESLELGGNCFIIKEHKLPNKWSTCHNIKADVYFIDNPEKYENEIEWNVNRKLKIEDFKGPVKKKAFYRCNSIIVWIYDFYQNWL